LQSIYQIKLIAHSNVNNNNNDDDDNDCDDNLFPGWRSEYTNVDGKLEQELKKKDYRA